MKSTYLYQSLMKWSTVVNSKRVGLPCNLFSARYDFAASTKNRTQEIYPSVTTSRTTAANSSLLLLLLLLLFLLLFLLVVLLMVLLLRSVCVRLHLIYFNLSVCATWSVGTAFARLRSRTACCVPAV